MTETDWLTTSDPNAAYLRLAGAAPSRTSRWLAFVGIPSRPVPHRKLRLFLCAAFRFDSAAFPAEWAAATAEVLDAAERVADGAALPDDVLAAIDAHWSAAITGGEVKAARSTEATQQVSRGWMTLMPQWRTAAARLGTADADLEAVVRSTLAPRTHSPGLADLVRCVFGNPFHRAEILDPWRTSTVLGIATAAYEDRTFGHLPVLADALQDAGCEDPHVLDHCRNGGHHARGCWVVDGILGLG